jgi:uncharacterized phage protein gp47/JayE
MSGGTGFGITDQGFVLAQLTDVQTDINNALIAQFGSAVNTNPESFFGQISGIMAERLALLWQAMQDVYNSQTPDTAFGASLDNVGALRGIPRLRATSSTIANVRLFGTAGTLIPATTTQFSVQGSPTSIFATSSAVTLVAGQSCIQTLTFPSVPVSGTFELALNGQATSALAYNVSAAALQTAIQALPFCSGCTVSGSVSGGFTITFNGPGAGGLMVQPQFLIENNSLVNSGSDTVIPIPLITQAGVDQGNVMVTATAKGPTIANAGTLNQILTPISGLTNVLSTQDATLGMDVETDNAYRARMATELQVAGAGTVEAIRAKLLTVTGVTSALVYENVSLVTNSSGLPAKSFEAVVNGGSDADIGNTLWAVKPAGIETYGNDSYVITDSQGIQHTMEFSRPTIVDVYLIVTLLVNTSFPSNGNVLVQEALANYINGLGQGVNVIVSPQLIAQLADIDGIDDVTILAGIAPGPETSNNIIVAAYEVAFTETSFITVSNSPG